MHIALGNLPCDTEICITSLLQLSRMMLLSLFPCFDYLFKCSVPPLPKGCNYPYRLNLLTWGGEVVQTRCQRGGSVNQTFCPFITSVTRSPTLESEEALVGWVGKWLKPGSKEAAPALVCLVLHHCSAAIDFRFASFDPALLQSSSAETVSPRCNCQPLDNYLPLL